MPVKFSRSLLIAALRLIGLLPLAINAQLAAAATPPAAVPPSSPTAAPSKSPLFQAARYTPAGLRLSFTPLPNDKSKGFIDLVLIPMEGDVIGRRVDVETEQLARWLRMFYDQLGTQKAFNLKDPNLPARRLYAYLIEPIAPDLKRLGITTLLISTDTTLQAIPFAALTDGLSYFGESFAFSLTPSIRLTPLQPPQPSGAKRMLVAGASRFATMSPLPMVPQELNRVTPVTKSDHFLNESFTPSVLLNAAANPAIRRIHLATHAEFLPGGPAKSKLYTGTTPLSFAEFAALRQRRRESPLDLFTLSACRTALGDPQSELGFAGLALQAGARTAVGTLWYVDDVATSAFFVQFYRYLDLGLPKAEALQATRRAFASGLVQLEANRLIGDGGELVGNLSNDQRVPLVEGLRHPYFWAGVTMLGSPW